MQNSVFSLEELFTNRLFQVPDYQRGYAWEEKHLSEFIDDVELLPNGKDHYTGTVVVHPVPASAEPRREDDEGRRYEVLAIVDGQQRLTTVVILLEAIRREMAGAEELQALARGLRRGYVSVTGRDGQPLHRLRLNRDCRDYFAQRIIAEQPRPLPATIPSHERLEEAQKYFANRLADKKASLGPAFKGWLEALRDKLVRQLKVTLYVVGDQADVGVIFEVLNNRGKPLSELEKVKNYLLYLASKLTLEHHTLADEVNRAWTHVFERLMASHLTGAGDEDQLLRAHWIAAYDPVARNWDGSNSIKKGFNLRDYQDNHTGLLTDVLKYVRDLEAASLAFCDAHRPDRSDAFAEYQEPNGSRQAIARFSEKLRRTRVLAPFLPLLIAARLRWPGDGAKYLEIVKLCELFAFRVYRFLGVRSHAGQSNLFWLANRVFGGAAPRAVPQVPMPFDDAVSRMRGTLLYYCPNARFAGEFGLRDDENDWYGWYGLRYLLYEYEEHLAGREVVRLPWSAVEQETLEKTIEHILPQTPADSYWTERFSEAQRRRFTHDLGNLCLTSHNSSYGNKPFPEKRGHSGLDRNCYARSAIFQERDLARFEDWDEPALLRRREEIVRWALRRWHVEEPAEEQPVPEAELVDEE